MVFVDFCEGIMYSISGHWYEDNTKKKTTLAVIEDPSCHYATDASDLQLEVGQHMRSKLQPEEEIGEHYDRPKEVAIL